jgi:hypothetical protein
MDGQSGVIINTKQLAAVLPAAISYITARFGPCEAEILSPRLACANDEPCGPSELQPSHGAALYRQDVSLYRREASKLP